MKRILFTVVLSGTLALGLSSCLKTRSQLRGEDGGPDQPDPVYTSQVKEVSNSAAEARALDDMKGEIAQLNARLEELARANQQLKEQNTGKSEESKKMETRIQELEATQAEMIERLKKKEKEQETPKTEPVAMYEQGVKQAEAKDCDGAIASLSEYLKFPKGKHMENAFFHRGECYFAKGEYKKAILDFSSVHDKFPRSKKMPQALYKTGLSFEKIGMKSDAKVFYQELVDKFPKSPEAKKAVSKAR